MLTGDEHLFLNDKELLQEDKGFGVIIKKLEEDEDGL